MQSSIRALLALFSFVCAFVVVRVALAEEAVAAAPATGYPIVDQLFAYLGMAAAGLSALGAILPRTWRLTQLVVRFSADLRGILTPDTADDSWLKRGGGGTSLLILSVLLGAPGCAWFKGSVAPAVFECAPDRQYLIDGLSHILDGENAFDVLDGIRKEKGAEFVLCTLQHFLDRVAVSPETAVQRARARAYLERK